jgi:N-acetylglucosamine-6-sulfatase
MRRLPLSVAALCAVAALAVLGWGDPTGTAGAAKPNQDKPTGPVSDGPNIVTIVTDDQTLASLTQATMPNTLSQIGAQGTSFTNMIATTPLCCPSRASFLTGQYAHNHQVLNNKPGYATMLNKRNVLPTSASF